MVTCICVNGDGKVVLGDSLDHPEAGILDTWEEGLLLYLVVHVLVAIAKVALGRGFVGVLLSQVLL